MKSSMKLALGLAFISQLSACGVSKTDLAAKKASNKAGASNDSKAAAETCKPTAPGDIYIGGVLLTLKDGNDILDSHVFTDFVVGKNLKKEAQPTVMTFVKATNSQDSTVDALEEISQEKTYINLGCTADELPATTKEMKLVEMPAFEKTDGKNSTNTISAGTIFVCGNQTISNQFPTIMTGEINFLKKDSSLAQAEYTVSLLSILTKKLTLNGNNTISVKAKDASLFATPGTNLSITVTEKLDARSEDTLVLKSTAGSCVQDVQEKVQTDKK